ncbi:hypothetical protein GH714_013902 [Hevea brasiliensis]|uniref:Uncharacterized protein n=1 Tax=Hevea brasiliensis TaxID=3981 RepID=A0A6A6LJ53_HEVBR|nr:hypothetical protein GH714_013902 [Hevea brasiliensis]
MLHRQKKKGDDRKNRFLITINVLGSAGPISYESMGADRIRRGKKLCAVQEARAATDDRREVRDDSPQGIWLEGLAQQVL